ncbi:MAG: HAD family hydrolase [Promethearchaeota archaeon]
MIKGVRNKLNELRSKGYNLGIITSKKEELAKIIVSILEIKHYFDNVLGETEERKELGKHDLSFRNFFEEKFPKYQIIVIGDHPKDVMLSNHLKCPFIGVLTGNHSAQELKDSKKGKCFILNSIRELNENTIYELMK